MADSLPALLDDVARSLVALERLVASLPDPRLTRLVTARRRAVLRLGRPPAPDGPVPEGAALIASEWRLVRRLSEVAMTLSPGIPLRSQLLDLQAEVAESALILSRLVQ